MRIILALALAASFGISSAVFSQTDIAPARSTTTPAAVANPKDVDKTTAAPVAGKNSFTKKQVMDRLSANGYTTISDLTKDDQSIWHGTATKGGAQVTVAVDYQGNITAQ